MEGYRKEIQEILSKYGSLSEIIKKNGALAMADFAVSRFVELISKRYYKPSGTDYGLSEAVFQKPIDQFERYASIVSEIRKLSKKELLILDVGAGGKGVSSFEGLLAEKKCDFLLFDIKKNAFINLKKEAVIGDGCKLPFKNKAFDAVVSVDTVEHIPKPLRHNFYNELRRVCKKRLIITCPLQSDDGAFQGRTYDIIFQHLYERDHGFKEPNTQQHIASNHPTLEEICSELPSAAIYGYKNCEVWLKYRLFSYKPFARLFSGLLYYLFWKKNNYKQPYWGAIVTLDIG